MNLTPRISIGTLFASITPLGLSFYLLSLCLLATRAHAVGNPANGKRLAITCNACHGAQGISNNALWPNLAGQKSEYLVKQLNAFRSESRKDLLMTPISKNLSDSDIEDLAAYFAGLSAL